MLPPGSLPCGPRSAVGKACALKAPLRLHMNDTPTLGRGQQGPWGSERKRQQYPAACPLSFQQVGGPQSPEPQTSSLTPWQTVPQGSCAVCLAPGSPAGMGQGPGWALGVGVLTLPRPVHLVCSEPPRLTVPGFVQYGSISSPNLQEPKSCYLCR